MGSFFAEAENISFSRFQVRVTKASAKPALRFDGSPVFFIELHFVVNTKSDTTKSRAMILFG